MLQDPFGNTFGRGFSGRSDAKRYRPVVGDRWKAWLARGEKSSVGAERLVEEEPGSR